MKIKINPNEFYEIALPGEISLAELEGILSRLKAISKISTPMIEFDGEKTVISGVRNPRSNQIFKIVTTREQGIEFIKLLLAREDNEIMQKYNYFVRGKGHRYSLKYLIRKRFGISDAELK